MHPDRLAAACRLLIDTGDLTPQGARVLQKLNAEEVGGRAGEETAALSD